MFIFYNISLNNKKNNIAVNRVEYNFRFIIYGIFIIDNCFSLALYFISEINVFSKFIFNQLFF